MSVPDRIVASGGGAVKIAEDLERSIADGRLRPGDRLPAVRELAGELGRSPATVAAAYARLRDRGVLVTEGRRGTFVSARRVLTGVFPGPPPDHLRDLASGNPDPALLPDLRPVLESLDVTPRLYGEAPHDEALIRVASRRFRADGLPADRVGVAAGALDALERIARTALKVGDRIVVEDPGYFGAFDLLAGLGLRLVPASVDDEGLRPDALADALQRGARAVLVTPRAQNPTGAALTEPRVRELRAVLARHPETLVLEDDHAGDIAGAAPPPLRADDAAPWFRVHSVSKALGPDLRLAVFTGDRATMESVETQQRLGMRWVSHLLQRTVAGLWASADVRRQLRHARDTYARRRGALLAALEARGFEATGASGLNVWIPLREETAWATGLAGRGWAVAAGERFRLSAAPALRVTTAALDEADAQRFADDLAALRDGPRAGPAA